ncbi:MAG: hypothetical protein ACR2PB_01830, partial [Desulfocapsaceae bacterium]
MLRLFLSPLFFIICYSLIFGPGLFGRASAADRHDQPIFDTHVHYKEPAWSVYPPSAVIDMMKSAGVAKALVSST